MNHVASPDTLTTAGTVPLYEMLAQDIAAMGVDTCFGLASDDTLGLFTALDSAGIHLCTPRHETNAVLAAEGYAAASGKLGIAVIGRGPAAANGMHGIMVAARSGSPVLIIMGDSEPGADTNAIGPDYKAYEAAAVMHAAGLRTFTVSCAATARATLASAAAAALRGAAVTLHIPVSVQDTLVDPAIPRPALPAGKGAFAPAAPRPSAIEAALAILKQAKRPLIVGGLGAYRAGAREALEQLAERSGALLATSFKGKDLFRGSPYNLGIVGSFSHSLARRHVEQADCILVFGAGLNFYTTSKGKTFPAVPIIQIDAVRRNIGRWHPADVAIVGDARAVAGQLAAGLPQEGREKPFHDNPVLDEIAGFDPASDFQAADTRRTLDPRTLAVALEAILPQPRNLIYDAGNFIMVASYLSVPGPGHLKVSSDFASMGAGFGTALGVATARPEETNILVVGDGGFLMALSELETVARLGLSLVIVVVNDRAYGAELQFCRLRNLPEATSVFVDIDFATVAESFGFQAATLRTREDIEGLREQFTDWSGPILLDCKVNADVQAPFISELVEAVAR